MSTHALIISAGNWMYGDDAAGIIVANELHRRMGDAICVSNDPRIIHELVQTGDDSPQLIALLTTTPHLTGHPPGSWWRVDCRHGITGDLGDCLGVKCSLSPTALERLAGRLRPRHSALWVYTIAGEDFHLGAPLSVPVTRALEGLTSQIESDIRKELGLALADFSQPLTAAIL